MTLSIVGLVGFYFSWGGETIFLSFFYYSAHPQEVMEDVLNDWKWFSLLEEETNRVSLEEENFDDNEVILAAKFMTKRALNIEAIGRTLRLTLRLLRELSSLYGKPKRVLRSEMLGTIFYCSCLTMKTRLRGF